MSNDTTNQLQEQTDHIAEMLVAAYEDRLYTDEDGNMEVLDEGEELPGDYDTVGLVEYLDDCYDVTATVNMSNRDVPTGYRIMVACGGPNIYIDTNDCEVQGFWWTDRAVSYIPGEVCSAIDDEFTELYWGCY